MVPLLVMQQYMVVVVALSWRSGSLQCEQLRRKCKTTAKTAPVQHVYFHVCYTAIASSSAISQYNAARRITLYAM
eukprot:18249-Heterococcus_DN1.PRE.2